MKLELEKKLIADYPLIFPEDFEFECGNGWYNILNDVCGIIQHHINQAKEYKKNAEEYNEMALALKRGDETLFNDRYKMFLSEGNNDFVDRQKIEILNSDLRNIPIVCPQIVAHQVKEKFGELRFYYEGGDEYCSGALAMAEAISVKTCEVCGAPGIRRGKGWIRTLCNEHGKNED